MTWGRSFCICPPVTSFQRDMGTDTKGPSLVSLVSHFSETHGDRYKRTVPLNLDKDIVQLQNTGVLNIFGNR